MEAKQAKQSDAASSMEAIKGLVPQDKIEGLNKKPEEIEEKPVEKQVAAPEPKKSEEPVTQDKPSEDQKLEDSKRGPVTVDTPFGKRTVGEQKQAILENFEDVQKLAKQRGFEIKNINDFGKVFDQYKELESKATEGDQYKVKAQEYENIFENFPEEISAIVYAHLQGQDYKEILNKINSKLDYSKPFDEHQTLNLVNHYTESSFDKDSWDDLEESHKRSLLNAAKRAYTSDQKEYKATISTPRRTADEFKKNFQQSVENSIARLRADYPEMDSSQVERVRRLMTGELHGTLFNDDNTFKPDAAERLAMQEFGKTTIDKFQHTLEDVVKMYESKGESKANERMLSRSDGPPDESGRSVQDRSKEINQAVREATSFMRQ